MLIDQTSPSVVSLTLYRSSKSLDSPNQFAVSLKHWTQSQSRFKLKGLTIFKTGLGHDSNDVLITHALKHTRKRDYHLRNNILATSGLPLIKGMGRSCPKNQPDQIPIGVGGPWIY